MIQTCFKRLALLSLVIAAWALPATGTAAYNVQYQQYGVVSYSETPAYSVSNYGVECRYGSCVQYQGGAIDYNWTGQQACEYAIARAGIPDTSDITCAHERYTTGGSYGSGYYGSGGGSPPGGTLTVPQAYASVFVGHGVPKESSCVQPTASTCGVYIHTAPVAPPPPPPAPTASLSASPATVAYGGSSALTHYCTDSTSASISYVGSVSASSGTTSVTPGSTTTYTLTCSGPGGTTYAYATVNVVYYPDLYSTIGPSRSVIAGQANTYSGATYNQGQASSGGSNDLFIFYDASYNWVSYAYVYPGAIGPGGGVALSTSYTFSSAGTYYYRLCADWSGTVAESNEGNNCSGLASISVAPPVPPNPTGLTASCNAAGTQVTLSWNAAPGAVDYYVRLYDGVSSNPYSGYAGYNDYYTGTSITYNVVPGRYHDWWVHSRNGTGYSNPPAYGSFTCVGYPDLVAGSVSVSQTVPGRNTTLSAVASNISGGSSGAFPMLFQVANAAQTQTVALLNSGYISLTPGESYTTSASWTPSAGTYSIRACANYNTSWTAITSESNYGNNCGPWTTVTFQNTGSLSCTTPSATAEVGQSVTYTAVPAGGAGSPYSWNDGQGGSYGSGNTATRTFTALGTYAMSVGADNTVQSSYTCTAGGQPYITVGCAAPHTASITAAATRVRQGQGTTLTWSGAGVNTSCVLSGPGVSQTTPANSCAVPSQTTSTGALSTQSRYCVTCDGSVQQCVTVNVIPQYEEF